MKIFHPKPKYTVQIPIYIKSTQYKTIYIITQTDAIKDNVHWITQIDAIKDNVHWITQIDAIKDNVHWTINKVHIKTNQRVFV